VVNNAKINVKQNANVVESVHANFESQTHASNRDGTIKNMNGNRKNYKQQNWCLIEIKMITRFGNIVAYHRIRLIKIENKVLESFWVHTRMKSLKRPTIKIMKS